MNKSLEGPWRPTRDEMRALIQRGLERGWLSVRKDAAAMPKIYASKGPAQEKKV